MSNVPVVRGFVRKINKIINTLDFRLSDIFILWKVNWSCTERLMQLANLFPLSTFICDLLTLIENR